MTTLQLVEKKAEKRIGMTAYTKTACAFHGKPGKVTDYRITKTGDEKLPYAISYVLEFKSGEKFISHEKDTVLFLGSKN